MKFNVRSGSPLSGSVALGTLSFPVTGLPGMSTALTVEGALAALDAEHPVGIAMATEDGRVDIPADDEIGRAHV